MGHHRTKLKWYQTKKKSNFKLESKCFLKHILNRGHISIFKAIPEFSSRESTKVHLLHKNEGPGETGDNMTMTLDKRKSNFENQ